MAKSSTTDHLATAHLTLKQTKQSGRGVIYDLGPSASSQTPLKAGTTLWRLQPLASIISTDVIRDFCSGCGASRGEGKLGHCQQCRFVRYCSEECKEYDWSHGHAYECASLAALRRRQKMDQRDEVRMPSEDVRLVARLVWMRRHVVRRVGDGSEHWSGTNFTDLNSQLEHHKRHNGSQLTQCTQQVRLLLESSVPTETRRQAEYDFSEHFNLHNDDHLSSLISTVWTNVHAWSNSSLDTIGLVLSPQAAMLNHSCRPNVNLVFPRIGSKEGTSPPSLHLVACRYIKPGQELCITYLDLADDRATRQEKLRLGYGFECRCRSCRAGDLDPREVMWCPSRASTQCSGWIRKPTSQVSSRSVSCQSCQRTFEVNDIDILSKTTAAVQAIQAGQRGSSSPETLKSHLVTLLKLYPPCSYPLIDILDQVKTHLVDSYRTTPTSTLARTILRLQLHYVAGIKSAQGAIYNSGHPKRAIALVELAQWLITEMDDEDGEGELGVRVPGSLQRVKWCEAVLDEAREVVSNAFGAEDGGGLLGAKVRELEEEVRVGLQRMRGAA